MLIIRSFAVWKSRLLNCSATHACTSKGIRFKSAWLTKDYKDGHQSSPYLKVDDLNVEELFINDRVQAMLKSLTGMNLEKIYADRIVHAEERKHYALMTDGMIEDMKKKMSERAERFLQFVPLKEPRSDQWCLLAMDAELNDFDTAKFVCTDISPDVTDQDRIVVVREQSGALRTALPEEHDRMNRTYYTSEDRPVREPPVFSDPSFSNALKKDLHEFVLDFACHFFEPNDPRFVKLSIRVFDEAAKQQKLGVLHSTRHFGTMVFYFLINQQLPPVLDYFGSVSSVRDSADSIRLAKILLPKLPWDIASADNSDEEVVRVFLEQNKHLHEQLPRLLSLMGLGPKEKELKEKISRKRKEKVQEA